MAGKIRLWQVESATIRLAYLTDRSCSPAARQGRTIGSVRPLRGKAAPSAVFARCAARPHHWFYSEAWPMTV